MSYKVIDRVLIARGCSAMVDLLPWFLCRQQGMQGHSGVLGTAVEAIADHDGTTRET
jgi:hypothetical protein